MKKRTILLLILMIAIGGIIIQRLVQISIDKSKIEVINEYKEAAKVLLENINEIEGIDRSRNENKYKYGNSPFTILSTGEYYFENTLIEETKADLSEVKDLWDKDLLEGKFHCIKMTTDSTIIFKIKEIENFSSFVNHSIIYGQKENIDEILEEFSFNRTKRFNDNWVYVSSRNYKLIHLLRM
jgi:hypothetical protein